MTSYIQPEIISKILQVETAMSQYGFGQTPNCDGNQCSTSVGVNECNIGETSDTASIIFFLPESDLTHTPTFCNITGVANFADAPQEVSGSNCSFEPIEACENGAIWKITCEMPANFCDPDEIKVNCEGTPGTCQFIE